MWVAQLFDFLKFRPIQTWSDFEHSLMATLSRTLSWIGRRNEEKNRCFLLQFRHWELWIKYAPWSGKSDRVHVIKYYLCICTNGCKATETETKLWNWSYAPVVKVTCPSYTPFLFSSLLCQQAMVCIFCYSTGRGNYFNFKAGMHALFTCQI